MTPRQLDVVKLTPLADGDGVVVVPYRSTAVGGPVGAVEAGAGAILQNQSWDLVVSWSSNAEQTLHRGPRHHSKRLEYRQALSYRRSRRFCWKRREVYFGVPSLTL